MQHHKWSLDEIGNLIPWEREIYVSLLSQFLEEERQKIEEEKQRIANGR